VLLTAANNVVAFAATAAESRLSLLLQRKTHASIIFIELGG
jgi:hypothetical protein